MIELAFSGSAAGSLKMAKSWQQEKEQCGISKDVAALTIGALFNSLCNLSL